MALVLNTCPATSYITLGKLFNVSNLQFLHLWYKMNSIWFYLLLWDSGEILYLVSFANCKTQNACVHAKSLQSCPTVCDPMDCSPPGSSVHGILQARISVGCHALLQGIFPIQGSNPRLLHLLHWQAGSLPLVPPKCVSHSVVLDSLRPHGL